MNEKNKGLDTTSYLLGKKSGGVQPSGKITITQNGTNIDVSSYATADVNVPGGSSEYFNSTISAGPSSSNTGFLKSIKKIPNYTLDGTSLQYGFCGTDFTNVNFPTITNIDQCTNFQNCFSNCLFNVLDLSNVNFSNNITNLSYLFSYAKGSEINLSSLGQINQAVNCNSMFSNINATKIDLSNFDPTVSFEGARMFQRCSNLTYLDISKIDFAKCNSSSYMFENVPSNCLIYVKDQTAKDWFTTNFPELTNIQIK